MENRLLLLRRAKGIKQYDLARVLEVSPSFLCKIEKGLHDPTEEFKKRCSEYFDEKVDTIFSEPVDKKNMDTAVGGFFSNNLWKFRVIKNIKQNRLAEMLGCSPSYLSKIEKGTQIPNINFRKKCAKILKIKEAELFPADNSVQ